MHVLMLPSWYPTGAEDFHGSFFREQATALAAAGHKVGVVALEAISITAPGAVAALRLRVSRATEGLPGEQLDVFRAVGLRPIPMAHRFNVRALARRWERVFLAYVRECGMPDVLHAHAMNPGGVAAARIAKKYEIPFVVTEHRPDSAIDELTSQSLAGVLFAAAGYAKRRVAVSPAFAESLSVAYGGQEWDVIPNMLPRQFESYEPAKPAAGPFVFGHVSNLHPYKRVGLLLDAFAAALGDARDVRLRIAGDSEYLAEHREHAERLGLENVEFVGAVSRGDIAAEFSNYHAFVMPSAAESFGVVFWEALACGVPLIATATDGGRYAVRPDTGLLVGIDDQVELQNALLRMRNEADQYDRGHLRAVSMNECGQTEFVRMYTEVYNAAMTEEQ